MSLYPTPTRVALLIEIADGVVFEGITEETEGRTWSTAGAEHGAPARVVTARVDELRRAGWVEIDDAETWRLTDAGRRVLTEGRAS